MSDGQEIGLSEVLKEAMETVRGKLPGLPIALRSRTDFPLWLEGLLHVSLDYMSQRPEYTEFVSAVLLKLGANNPLTVCAELHCLRNMCQAGLMVIPEPAPQGLPGPDFLVNIDQQEVEVETTFLLPGYRSTTESQLFREMASQLETAHPNGAYLAAVRVVGSLTSLEDGAEVVARSILEVCEGATGATEFPYRIAICSTEVLRFPACQSHDDMVWRSIRDKKRPLTDLAVEVTLSIADGTPGIKCFFLGNSHEEERHRLVEHKIPSKEKQASATNPSLLVVYHFVGTVIDDWAADDLCGTRKLEIAQDVDGNWFEVRKYRTTDGYFQQLASNWDELLLVEVGIAPETASEPLVFKYARIINQTPFSGGSVPKKVVEAVAGGSPTPIVDL